MRTVSIWNRNEQLCHIRHNHCLIFWGLTWPGREPGIFCCLTFIFYLTCYVLDSSAISPLKGPFLEKQVADQRRRRRERQRRPRLHPASHRGQVRQRGHHDPPARERGFTERRRLQEVQQDAAASGKNREDGSDPPPVRRQSLREVPTTGCLGTSND